MAGVPLRTMAQPERKATKASRGRREGSQCIVESECVEASAFVGRAKKISTAPAKEISLQRTTNVPVGVAEDDEDVMANTKKKKQHPQAAAPASAAVAAKKKRKEIPGGKAAVEENDSSNKSTQSAGGGGVVKLVGIVLGIYIFFLLFGYYQEQIFHLRDPVTGKRFSFSFWLVFIVCVSNTLSSFAMLMLQTKGHIKQAFSCVDKYVMKELFFISLTYVGAMLCTNYAMNHINYPTQVLVKSAKMVPIVVGGFIVFRRRYPWYDYASVLVVTVSLVLFNMSKTPSSSPTPPTTTSSSSSSIIDTSRSTSTGLLLLCVSLFCDGLTGPRQDRLLSRYRSIGPVLMMFLTNIFSIFWTATATTLIEGKAPYKLLLLHDHHALVSVLAFAVSGSLGQLFIYQSLKAFGSLYTSLFTTLRKATSTVLSVYAFGHQLTPTQWSSMTSIFMTLMLQSYFSKKNKKQQQNSKTNYEKKTIKQA